MKNLISLLIILFLALTSFSVATTQRQLSKETKIMTEKFRIEGIILKTKEDHKRFLKKYPNDPIGAGSFSGPKLKIFTNQRPKPDEKMIELLMDEWEKEKGERPYSAKLTAARWGEY